MNNRNNKNFISPIKDKNEKEKSYLFCCYSEKKNKNNNKKHKSIDNPIKVDNFFSNHNLNIKKDSDSFYSKKTSLKDKKYKIEEKQNKKINNNLIKENKEHRKHNSVDINLNKNNNNTKVNNINEDNDNLNDFGIVVENEILNKDSSDRNIRHTLNFERNKSNYIKSKSSKEENTKLKNNIEINENTIKHKTKTVNHSINKLSDNILKDIEFNEINQIIIPKENINGGYNEIQKANLLGNLNSPISMNKKDLKIEEEQPKLNYINDSDIGQINNEQIPISNINNMETKKEEEIDDEDLEIDDENCEDDLKIHDTKSIVSSYIFSMPKMMKGINDTMSYAPSLISKSDIQSNLLRMNSNKKIRIIPPNINNDDSEVEITNENGEGFKAFIESPHSSYFNNKKDKYKESSQFKAIYEKIQKKDKEIMKLKDKINHINNLIQSYNNENKKYEKWIEKEENEGEFLRQMLNFLIKNKY